jgi:hypothetical protein
MKIGAEVLVRGWGRSMTLSRAGTVLFSFKGRRANIRPEAEDFDQSVDQLNFRIIAMWEDFGGVMPLKFDVVTDERGEEFTVQSAKLAGADVDELIKMVVRGGQA